MSLLQSYKDAGNLFYGNQTGDMLYEFAEELCSIAFDDRISPEIPIILTTAQSAYNQYAGSQSVSA